MLGTMQRVKVCDKVMTYIRYFVLIVDIVCILWISMFSEKYLHSVDIINIL